MTRLSVSVVTVTRDRPEALERCVASALRQTLHPFEIVVLDNGDRAAHVGLRARLESLVGSSGIPLHLIQSPPIGFAGLRQRAMGAATGELLMSLDDDCVAAPDALENIVRRFEVDPQLGLLGGNLDNVGFEGAERHKGRGRLVGNAVYETVADGSDAEIFGSANQTIRRQAFEAIDGYDPFFTDGLEEADLVLSLRSRSWKIGYAPDVRIEHHHHANRHRGRWKNLNSMRLYLYFKHLAPSTLSGWTGFVRSETAQLMRDLLQQVRSVPARVRSQTHRGDLARVAVALAASARDAFKACVARLRIPELYVRSRRAR